MRSGVLRRLLCRVLFPFWVSCRASVQVQLLRSAVGKGRRGWLLQCLLHCGVLLAPNILLYAHCMLHSEAERQVIVCGLQIGSKARSLIFKPSKEVAGLAWLRTKRKMLDNAWLSSPTHQDQIIVPFGRARQRQSQVFSLDRLCSNCRLAMAMLEPARSYQLEAKSQGLPRVARICGHVQPKGATLQTVQAGHHR